MSPNFEEDRLMNPERAKHALRSPTGEARAFCYVYVLRSINQPDQTYIGFSRDLRERFHRHNQGDSPHTAKFRPWELVSYFAFSSKETAIAFENYLKSHSGKTFAKKSLFSQFRNLE
ncbi:GIY-YIG nuclease family protein [Puniceicoccus vermicola]|nr:GIY-YIG nuclease family protein [Puniceicoccus vermicola]